MSILRTTLFASLFAALTALGSGCDLLQDLSGGDDSAGELAPPADDPADTTATPTPAAATPTAPNPNISVDLQVGIRSLVAAGHLYVEANFEWAARGAPGLIVDIQMKTDLNPVWAEVLTDQPAVDVATTGLQGPLRTFHFRAVAQDPGDPEHVYYSAITTIR